jgi:hypothetical protein
LTEVVAQRITRENQSLIVDLTKIEGDGDFPCLKCGIKISPDDDSEDVYIIVEEKIKNDILEELVIKCNNCGAELHLKGFAALVMNSSNLE